MTDFPPSLSLLAWVVLANSSFVSISIASPSSSSFPSTCWGKTCFQHRSYAFQCLFSSLSLPEPSLSFLDAFYHEFWSFRRALSLTDSCTPFYRDFSQNHKIFSALFIQFSHSCFLPPFLTALPPFAFFLLSCCSLSLSLLSFVIFWLASLAFCSLLLLSSSFVAFFLLWLLCRLGILI